MEEIDIALIKKKSITGMMALTSRTFLLQLIAFGSTFFLTIFLNPSVFGVFYIVSAIIAFLSYFSDIGLAAALIQKKEALDSEDLSTTFTIQQFLITIVSVLTFFLSGVIAQFYTLDSSGLFLLQALIISFFLSSLKTIPSVLLERKLEFNKLVVPQILETIAFYGTAVVLAWKGLGITSFTYGVLARAVVGLIAIYVISPWKVTVGFSPQVARRLLRFGVPFQLNSFLALVKDDLLTIFLGKILPFSQIGYIGWAKKWAEVPLRLIMDSVIRVTFPAFARLQESRDVLGRAIEKSLFGLSASMFPITIGLLFFVRPMVEIIPKYSKWEPAIFSFYLFSLASVISGLSTPLTNALNAIGKIRLTLYLMILWTVLTWILTVVFIHLFGFNGVALALLCITATVGIVIWLVKKFVSFPFISTIMSPLIGGFFQACWYILSTTFFPKTIVWLISSGIIGVALYIGVLWLREKARIQGFLAYIR